MEDAGSNPVWGAIPFKDYIMARPIPSFDLIVERFWSYVIKTDACWNWTGALDKDGYGIYTITTAPKTKTSKKVHRFSWELSNGRIPNEMCILHKCDNRRCVNPQHLIIGSHADNVKDMDSKGRRGSWHPFGALNGRYKNGKWMKKK